MYRGPFRRALFLLNHMFVDTIRDSIIRGLENIVELFQQYDVIPIDPTVELFARSLATQRRKKKRKKKKKRHAELTNNSSASPKSSPAPKAFLIKNKSNPKAQPQIVLFR